MGYKKCLNCQVRHENDGDYCLICEEMYFDRVKEFFKRFPRADIRALRNSEHKIPISLVKKFIDEGRLEIVNGVNNNELEALIEYEAEEAKRKQKYELMQQLQSSFLDNNNVDGYKGPKMRYVETSNNRRR